MKQKQKAKMGQHPIQKTITELEGSELFNTQHQLDGINRLFVSASNKEAVYVFANSGAGIVDNKTNHAIKDPYLFVKNTKNIDPWENEANVYDQTGNKIGTANGMALQTKNDRPETYFCPTCGTVASYRAYRYAHQHHKGNRRTRKAAHTIRKELDLEQNEPIPTSNFTDDKEAARSLADFVARKRGYDQLYLQYTFKNQTGIAIPISIRSEGETLYLPNHNRPAHEHGHITLKQEEKIDNFLLVSGNDPYSSDTGTMQERLEAYRIESPDKINTKPYRRRSKQAEQKSRIDNGPSHRLYNKNGHYIGQRIAAKNAPKSWHDKLRGNKAAIKI